jgi:hypothetical protein
VYDADVMAGDFKVHFLEGSSRDPFPFVVIPKAACPTWADAGVKSAKRSRGAFGIIEVGGAPSLVLPGSSATACIISGRCAYFVRWPKYKYGNHDALLNRLIAGVKDEQWKPRGAFEVANSPLQLFSASPSPYRKWARWEVAGCAIDVPLAKGSYDVHVAEHVTGERAAVDLVRLTPVGAKASAPKAKPADPKDAALAREVAKLRWVDSEGGPFVALPTSLRKEWRGAKHYGAGSSDYERACEIENASGAILEVGRGAALVVPGPESATAFEIDGAWLFVTQHAARDPREAYAAMRAAPEKSFKKQKAKLTVPAGGLELRDASALGSRGPSLKVPVKAGTYEVARATVKKSGIFLSLVRLRPAR